VILSNILLFYNINIPPNFLTLGYIDIELECPGQTTTAIDYITSNPLNNLYINLVIIDEDPEKTTDTILAPPIDMKHYNVNMPIKQYSKTRRLDELPMKQPQILMLSYQMDF
jgi:hypothetical protein